MSDGFDKVHQIATRKKLEERPGKNLPAKTGSESGAGGAGEPRLPVRLDLGEGSSDSLAGWLEAYFAVEVTTAASSQAVQRRDLTRFLAFLQAEEGSDERSLSGRAACRGRFWTPCGTSSMRTAAGAFPTAPSPASPRT